MSPPRDPAEDAVETQLVRFRPRAVAPGLREQTLARVNRELRSSRWDRRLGRLAALALVGGIGLNAVTADRRPHAAAGQRSAAHASVQSIVDLAVSVADVTGADAARVIGWHLAALHGLPRGSEPANMIAHQIDRRIASHAPKGRNG